MEAGLNHIFQEDDPVQNNFDQQQPNIKYPGPVAAGLFFSLTAVLLTYGGSLLPFKNTFLKSGIGEVCFVLLPVLIFLKAGGYNIKDTLKLKKTRPLNYLILVFLMIFAMPVVGVLNAVVLGIIRLVFGKNLPVPQIPIDSIPALFAALLVIGLSAAVCEETMFRGLVSKGYEKMGVPASLVLTSVLFGILHRDIQKAVSTILLGALIGFIVYRTKSIYAGMAAHFTNNAAAVLISYGASRMAGKMKELGVEQVENFDFSKIPPMSLAVVVVFYAFLFAGCLAIFTALFYAFMRSTRSETPVLPYGTEAGGISGSGVAQAGNAANTFGKAGILSAAPGVLLIFLIFTGQFLQLMNVGSGPVVEVLKAIGVM